MRSSPYVAGSVFGLLRRGIESAQELEYLKKAGVALGQGYFLARPSVDPCLSESLKTEIGEVKEEAGNCFLLEL